MSETTIPQDASSGEITLDESQVAAIKLCCGTDVRVAAVTGPAGTGKTTILKQVYEHFNSAGYQIALAAPTGKAAKRIAEATGLPAVTIHRLLEFTHPGDPDEKTGKPIGVSVPRRTRDSRLEQSVVLVDEYSMVNKQLHRDLMDAMPPGGIVRCFGDANQLPPIEENQADRQSDSPFEALVKQPQFTSTLTHIHRHGEGSNIARNAARILAGMVPMQHDDFVLKLGTPHAVNTVLDLVKNSGVDYNALDNQIITPSNKSWIGQVQLNAKIQNLLQGDKMYSGVVVPRYKWEKQDLMVVPGDKVIWRKNTYELELYNGEVGIIEEIADDILVINFGDRTVGVPPWVEYTAPDGTLKGFDPRVNLYLAYALTTHSTQGSEYNNIIYVMDRSTGMLHNRSNFYTAVTRGRKKVWIVSDQRSIQQSVSTRYKQMRF